MLQQGHPFLFLFSFCNGRMKNRLLTDDCKSLFSVIVEVRVVSKKNKRKITYKGMIYYWYVRINERGHRIHILSEDKKVHLEFPFLDTELPVTPQRIREHLREYYDRLT